MSDINVIIRTADRARKAEVTVSNTETCGDLIQAAIDNWALANDGDYTLTNISKTPPQTLNPATLLARAGVGEGEILEIQPVLVAGGEI